MPAKEETPPLYIPSELKEFVEHDTYSLLIKGYAGTGKTTLALTILRALNIKENFQYISTRISPHQLFQYYSWLGGFFGNTKELLSDTPENEAEVPIFVDARLDEPSSLFERVTNQLMDVRSPMIIIDSWDAVGYFMDREALMNNARVLQTWRERAKAKMIFISEEPENTTFDVLVDGIVELRQGHHDNRLIREIILSKLRGVRINRLSYLYTLNNSTFRSFEPYKPSEFAIQEGPKKKQIQRDRSLVEGNRIKATSAELDDAVGGGFPLKGVVNIRLNPEVNSKVVLSLLGEIMSNFVSAKGSVLCQCSQGADSDYLSNYLKASLDTPKTNGNLIFVERPQKNGKSAKKTPKNQLLEVARKTKGKHPGKLLLNVIFSDALDTQATNGTKTPELDKSESDLTIVVNTNSESQIHDFISMHSDVSIRFLEINGTLFMQSETPWSHLYAVSVYDGGYPRIRLEAVV